MSDAGSAQTGPGARVLYYDVLNVAACLGVLFLHFNGLAHAFEPSWRWLQALSAECLFYWAVPVFLMLSGATLLRYRERYSTKVFFKKRALGTLVPFVAWSLIALVWKVATGQMEAPQGLTELVSLVLNAQIIDIYWFFIPLFACYAAYPVLSLLCDGSHDRVLWYAVGAAFVFNSVLPVVLPVAGIQYNSDLGFPALGGYLMYPVLGYLLSRSDFSAGQRRLIYALGAFGLAFRYATTVADSWAAGVTVGTFWGYLYFPCVLLSVAVFVLFKQIRWEKLFSTPAREKALRAAAGASFGVYLTHMVFFWYALQVTGLDGGRLLWRTVMPFVAWAVCAGFTLLLKRIPVLRRIVP